MNVSRRWLEAFLRRPLDARDVAARLGMLGAPVDAIESLGGALAPFVVALVRDVQRHPDADKLSITSVDDGSGTIHTVVCGAPNVTAGARYPFARLGTTMPGGLVIERRKIRGQYSEGMLCSARELGLGSDADGLMTLETDVAPGTPLRDVLGDGDDRLVVDVTPNRPDLLGHKGVARELAIGFGTPLRLPDIPGEADLDLPTPDRHSDTATVGGIRVSIEDRDGCHRFLAAVIRGVSIGPSPAWLVKRLESVGQRSINNVVDASNYVMLELNQPTHAYDAATLRGNALIVRASRAGERVTTLDDVDREVTPGTLVIADCDRVIGLAGVMGGAATEVSDSTRDIFLECAWFDPARVRAGRRNAGLSTEASHRFERGTDKWGAVDAFRRALRLIVTVAGGKLDGATIDCFPAPSHPPRIFLRPARVEQVLGVAIPWIEVERCLVAIGATIVSKPDDGRIAVDVPGWRPDLVAEIDLIEEIARVYGYDAVPDELRSFRPASRPDDAAWGAAARLRTGLASLGLSEVMTLPMVAHGSLAATRIVNPLSADHGVMRESLFPALVEQVEVNWAAHTRDVRLFELGTVFSSTVQGTRPIESFHAAFVVTGARQPPHWSDPSRPVWERWDARWLFERLVALADHEAGIQVEGDGWIAQRPSGEVVGRCGPLDADAPPWADRVWGGTMAVSSDRAPVEPFHALPAFPAVSRDLALVVGLDQPVRAVIDLLRERGQRHAIESASVVDEYRGKGLPEGRRGITVRLIFRASERTLTDADVDQAVTKLCTSLERELGITLRTA